MAGLGGFIEPLTRTGGGSIEAACPGDKENGGSIEPGRKENWGVYRAPQVQTDPSESSFGLTGGRDGFKITPSSTTSSFASG